MTARAPRTVAAGRGGGGAASRPALPAEGKGAPQAAGHAALPETLREILERARARVASDAAAVEPGMGADELRGQLGALLAAVERAWAGGDAAPERAGPAVPVQRVLDNLRAAVLDEIAAAAASRPASEQIVEILRAFERVRVALDRDDAHRFASRLTGVGGLELIVEVAHDLRSPLASILFLAETLRTAQSGPVTPVQERQLGLIYSAAFGLSAMSSDVIELARGGDRLTDLDAVPFSVSDVLRGVRDIVLPMAEEKRLALVITPPEADFRVGHPGALNRVLLNLTTNALKFTAEGQVAVAARHRSRTRLEFSVQDTGRGIPPEVMSCLFDTFRRRRNAGEYSFSSAGLGLAICRRLIGALGGELKVDTEPGKGTRFHFVLDLPVAPRL